MSESREYVFEFYRSASSTEPAFSRALPFPDDPSAIREGALFLRNQQVLTPPAAAVVVRRGQGGVEKPLGRWIWDGEPRWTAS
jgi:hypothetical protein